MRVVITGGPGVGKSTLLDELARLGYRTLSESAREVIRERLARGLPRRPEPATFAGEVLRRDIEKHRAGASSLAPIFFDRSAVESLAMLHDAAPAEPGERARLLSTYRFHPRVFVLPPWRAIYVTDAERDQTFEEAERVDARIRACYREAGYSLLEVPCLTVPDRAAFVLRSLPLGSG